MTAVYTYKKNMDAVRRFFPGMERKIAEAPAAALAVETAASGEPTARLGGLYLHSARDPVREARRLAEGALAEAGNGREKSVLVLLGFGLGYAVEAAAALPLPLPVIVVEKRPELLRAAFECRDLSAFLGKGVIFVLGGDPAAVTEALRMTSGRPVLIKNPAAAAFDKDFYNEVERNVLNWRTKDEVNAATLRRFGKRWIRNQAANMEALRDLPGVGRLEGLFDFPVLLLAAGPSLDELDGKLGLIAERCITVAVDTALRFMRRQGVAPDFAVSVDPQYWNVRHTDRCLPRETILVTEAAVYPQALRESIQSGRVFLCGSLYQPASFIEARVDPKGRLGSGGSVASAAWDFAASLVCRAASPAIFIAGLDLAFHGFATHYKGALFEENALVTASRFLPAETKSFHALRDGGPFFAPSAAGGRVLTDKRLSLYASWFEKRIALSKNANTFRLSGKGLAINGMKTASIDDMLALPPCRSAISSRLNHVLTGIFQEWNDKNEAEARAERYETARAALFDGLEAALSAARSVTEAIRSAESAGGLPDLNAGDSLIKKIEAANEALRQSDVRSAAWFLVNGCEDALPGPPAAFLPLTKEIYGELAAGIEFTLSALRKPETLINF